MRANSVECTRYQAQCICRVAVYLSIHCSESNLTQIGRRLVRFNNPDECCAIVSLAARNYHLSGMIGWNGTLPASLI